MNSRLRRIFRGEESYGEGHPAEQARRYRLAELLPESVAQALRNSADVPRGSVDLLVSLSGFSPETTIFAFELLRPQRLMVIGSESTRASVDVIQEMLRLPLSRLDVRYVDPVDPLRIYQFVLEAAQQGAPNGDDRVRMIIDITGGKKVMSASAALAAAQLDLPLCYIDSTFDPEMRQSEPGTERLVILPNPTALFGDRELHAALVAFGHGAYGAALERFKRVAETAHEPARARVLRDLADVYQSWCDLNFAALKSSVPVLRMRLADSGYRVPGEINRRLQRQMSFLDSLVSTTEAALESRELLLNFYLLGVHYLRLGRYDFAALLYYRTIESCFAQRLARIGREFQTARPDYSLLHDDLQVLQESFGKVAADVHGVAAALPSPVALMDAALLLCALDDPLIRALGLTTGKALRNLKNNLAARNRSVLAHGTDSIKPDLSRQLGDLALRSVRVFWGMECGGESVDERIAALAFVSEA